MSPIGYDNVEKNVLDDISIKISKNDRLGLLGKNGTGKSTFLKALLGSLTKQKGNN